LTRLAAREGGGPPRPTRSCLLAWPWLYPSTSRSSACDPDPPLRPHGPLARRARLSAGSPVEAWHLGSCTYSKSARRPENKHVAKVRLDRGARAVRRSLDRRPRAVPSRRDLRRASWTVPVSDRRRGMTAHRIHVHRMCASFLARAVWPKKCVGQPRRCISDSQQGVCWRRRRAKSRGAPLARSGGPRPKGREKADRREARRLARAAGHRGRRAGSRTRDLGRTLRLLGAGSSDGPDSPRDNSRPHARRLRLLAVVDKLLELTDELLECAA